MLRVRFTCNGQTTPGQQSMENGVADLRCERKHRVATGENQPKAIVGDLARVVIGFLEGPVEP